MNALLEWLSSLPTWALYSSLALIAAAENVFPPIPADTVVGVGSFLAARGSVSLIVAATLDLGRQSLLGALGMYRRPPASADGSAALMKRMGGAEAEARVATMYASYGMWALFVSRFLPGVRAVVPPVAGALRIPLRQVLPAMAIASAIWYGAIAWLGFRFGQNLDQLQSMIGSATRTSGLIAVVIVLIAVSVIWYRRRHRTP
ncbi:MAG: DedA family protein [Gemmatimonadaceae bacterium]|nr:DedA family protein [Gemmatimonadaceae bacterium]